MQMYYYRGKNFGDLLNSWIWPKYLGDALKCRTDYTMIGIGTLLDQNLPAGPKVVFGTGTGYGVPPSDLTDCKIFFVRGPLTAARLSLASSTAICDPGILVAEQYFSKNLKQFDIGYMPHHENADDPFIQMVCKENAIMYIDPRNNVDQVLNELTLCTRLVTEAMHGAIVADALRIPWCPVLFHDSVNVFKWRDYTESIEINYSPLLYSRPMGYGIKLNKMVPTLSPVFNHLAIRGFRRQLKDASFVLSDHSLLVKKSSQIKEQITRLREFLYSNSGKN